MSLIFGLSCNKGSRLYMKGMPIRSTRRKLLQSLLIYTKLLKENYVLTLTSQSKGQLPIWHLDGHGMKPDDQAAGKRHHDSRTSSIWSCRRKPATWNPYKIKESGRPDFGSQSSSRSSFFFFFFFFKSNNPACGLDHGRDSGASWREALSGPESRRKEWLSTKE